LGVEEKRRGKGATWKKKKRHEKTREERENRRERKDPWIHRKAPLCESLYLEDVDGGGEETA